MDRFKSKAFRSKYVIALSLIGLLVTASLIVTERLLSSQSGYAELINLSGRQRMLSQKISLHTTQYKLSNSTQEKKILKEKTMKLVNLFEKSHYQIINQNWQLKQSQKLSSFSKSLYFKQGGINELVYTFLSSVKDVLSDATPRQNLDNKFIDQLLTKLDEAVRTFEQENINATNFAQKVQIIIFVIIIIALFFEIVLIFIPLEETLKRLFSHLEEEKQEAIKSREFKSKFISHISHEIRTPLNGIVGSINLLETEELSRANIKYFDIISNCSKSAVDLINDFLEFEKLESSKITIYNDWLEVNTLLNFLSIVYTPIAEKKSLDFIIENKLEHKFIKADLLRVKQVFEKLISNSLRMTQKGFIKIVLLEKNNHLIFEVEDTGIGIEESFQDQMFHPFTREKNFINDKSSGSGLGLTITEHLITLMNGEIDFLTDKKVGTTFIVKIPTEFSSSINTAAKQIRNSSELKILIAEDNETNLLILKRYCQKLGHQYDFVFNGEEALAKLKACEYDVILTDIQMPIMDGVELLEKAKSLDLLLNTKIMAITANAEENDRAKLISQGFCNVLEKPLSLTTLREALEEI